MDMVVRQILSQWTCTPMIIVNKFITNAPYNYGINTWIRWLALRTQRCFAGWDLVAEGLDKCLKGQSPFFYVWGFVFWNWNAWLTLVTYFHIYYESFTSSILGNLQAVPLMRDIVYLTASYFLLWKFYLVTLGNFFQAAPLTRDCLILLPLVATLILSSIMGPFMFLFLGCVTCLLILLLPPLILGLAQSASLRLLGSDKLKV